jgi:(p)ppGpp synthase/HD superfamily hydrolase
MKTAWDQDAYLAALCFAAEAHRGQTVPGSDGLPYLVHLASVAMEVMGALQHEAVKHPTRAVLCALLHDTIEDTAVTHAEVHAAFGPEVADGVLALSKDAALPKAARMEDSLARIRRLAPEIWMVKLADRITNLQEPPAHWTHEKRRRYWEEAGRIRDALGDASAYLRARIEAKMATYTQYLEED